MRRALGEYHVGGISTNLAFHRQVMRHPAFVAGRVRHRLHRAPQGGAGAGRRRRRDGDAGGDRRRGRTRRARWRGRRRRATLDLVADAAIARGDAGGEGLTAPLPSSTSDSRVADAASQTALLVAFATLYVVWGSTYLAIRIAVASWPPS